MKQWTTPVTDRTSSDIDNKTPKAYINASDLNRIEGNIKWLAENLPVLLDRIQTPTVTDWDESSVPTTGDIWRICDNITGIMDNYYRPNGYEDVPNLAARRLHYADVNLLEMNLFLLKRLVDGMVAGFRKPSFKTGAKQNLPKRRMQS
jgi:hypothetical protein